MNKIPKKWSNTYLGEILVFKNGINFSKEQQGNKGILTVDVLNMYSDSKVLSTNNLYRINKNISNDYKLENDDILFVRSSVKKDGVGWSSLFKLYSEDVTFCGFIIRGRLKRNDVFPEYLIHYLRSNTVRNQMISGSGQSTITNINQKALSMINIPLPSLPEQKCIVSKIDILFKRINKSIALLEKNIQYTESLISSVLHKIFEGNKWKKEPLNLVAEVARGKSKHRPRNDKKLLGGDYPFVQTGEIRNAKKYVEKFDNTYSEFGLAQSKLWKKGTICLTIAANIGDVAILGFDACFPDSVVGITSNKMDTEFLYYYLKTLQMQLDKKANSAAQKNINLKILSEIEVPCPNMNIQKSVAQEISQIESKQFQIIKEQQSKLNHLKALKASILDSAFKGELT